MVPDVSTGSDSRGLIAYLFGPGRRDEHTNPHIVAAWDMAGAPDPGRDSAATYSQLARRLDHHVDLRTRELGGKKPPQHVWHCPVRTAPGDRYLTDAEWAEVARRVVDATGIAPDGDERACRWIAVRHADYHIHIMATTVRADGRRPRTHQDGRRAQAECRRIETEFGLRRLKSGDLTAPRTATSAERAKAERQGQTVTARQWLRERAYAVAAAVHTEADYFTVLQSLGIKVKTRLGPESGDVIGYSLAAPGDANSAGEPVWYGGSKLAPDLSINRLRERLSDQEVTDNPRYLADTTDPWRHTTTAVHTAHTVLRTGRARHRLALRYHALGACRRQLARAARPRTAGCSSRRSLPPPPGRLPAGRRTRPGELGPPRTTSRNRPPLRAGRSRGPPRPRRPDTRRPHLDRPDHHPRPGRDRRPQPPPSPDRGGLSARALQCRAPRRGPQLAHHRSAEPADASGSHAKRHQRNVIHVGHTASSGHTSGYEARRAQSALLTPASLSQIPDEGTGGRRPAQPSCDTFPEGTSRATR